MGEKKRYTITAALPYANGPLHLGHLAGAYLPADIFVRYLKAKGNDVAFICGSDEHGAAITLRAKKEGCTPQEIVDKNHEIIKNSFADFGIDFDIYHRTSSKLHHETASQIFKDLYDKGAFTQETTEQFFDQEHQQFLADRYVTGTCPKCNSAGAYGDQCEKCGSSLNANELINPISMLSGKTPILKETTHWFLPMNKHEKWLKTWIETGVLDGKQQHNPNEWRKQVIGQCKSWIDNGLQPRSITRDLDWGVKVPVEGGEGKVLYVWFDAPIGYISATKQWATDNGKNWEDYWKDSNTQLIHFIGKDNIVFHGIIFPIILKEHGDFILPTNVPANEFLNLEGDKISTSRNWAVWLHEYLEDFPNKQDELRYVLTSIAPETKDSEFTWKDFQARVNNELVAILGNFLNRSIVLTHKYFEGKVPEQGLLTDYDHQVLQAITSTQKRVDELIETYRFRDAQTEAMTLARLGNKYLADTEPWKLIKTDETRVKTILNVSLQLCLGLSEIFKPFLPKTSVRIKQFLNTPNETVLTNQHQLNAAELLFEKIEDEAIEAQIEKLKKTIVKQSNPKAKPMKTGIRLMIVDNHKIIRDGIKLILKNNPEIKLIVEAENGLEAIKYINNNPTSVDVVLMDISIPKLDGIAATKEIKRNHKNIHVLAITMHIEESYINDIMKAGASGYVLKESGRDDLIEAIRKVADGKLYFSSEVSSIIIENMLNDDSKNHTKSIISDKEKEVIKFVSQGISNAEIGTIMNLSTRTIESYRRNILQKLELKNLNEAQSFSNIKPLKDEISYEDFTKLDIRLATILAAEKHPNADKLLKLTVDTGIDIRTVVSGIAEHYKPEDVVGKQVSILMNLAPRKIRGIESKGMILMAENNEGSLAFISPEKAMDNGGEVK